MKYQALAAMIVLALAAPVTTAGVPGYLTDTSGTIVRNTPGECWHTGFWTPEMAVVGCDGKLADASPTPEPQVAVPPEPRMAKPLVLDADTYFDFDKASLKPAAVDKLDALATEIKDRGDVQQLRIVGHADRIGNDSYNQALSLRRAKSVAQHLIERQALPQERIEVKGMGESQPVVPCEGVRGSALVQCLAPNRRVEIEVVTTREAQ
jgi:OOP family OmpA-OmpF porin